MRWISWWQLLAWLAAGCTAQQAVPSLCEEDSCRCDAFTRVICQCTGGNGFGIRLRSTDYWWVGNIITIATASYCAHKPACPACGSIGKSSRKSNSGLIQAVESGRENGADITLRPDGAYSLPSMTSGIMVDGCESVYVLPDTIKNLMQLRNIEIKNVQHVYINERGLAWSPFSSDSDQIFGIKINIHNSTVDEISSHAIQGRVTDIAITKSILKSIKPFAFSSLSSVRSIELTDNSFENIEIQAFKKFTTWNFLVRGGTIRLLPSRFLSDVEVTNLFRMDGVNVVYVHSLSFLVSSPKRVLIENNIIGTLEGDAFHIVTKGPITFRNNTVVSLRKGAFFGLSAAPDVTSIGGLQELFIDNNTISDLAPSSLLYNRSTLTLRVDGLNLNATCACELAESWQDVVKEQGGTINCWYALEGHYISLPTFIDSRCGAFKQNFWMFVVVGIIFVVIVASIVTLCIVKRENEKKKKLQIVMPDGKTYRETELHIVVERAELLTTDL